MKSTGTSAALMLLAIMQSQSAIADAEQKQNFNIPAQSLSSALLQFSENTGVKTFFSADLTRDIKTQGLSGSYTPQQALDKLLANTGVAYRFTDTESVALSVAQKKNNEGTTTLKAVTVTGKTKLDPNDPYNKDYAVTHADTATKTDTPIMETPASIQVIPKSVFHDQQAYRLQDVVKNVSGVQSYHGYGGMYEQFVMRGFLQSTLNYRNGVRIPFTKFDLANVERVEVLKGASAMLYGFGDPGGMISTVTKQPSDTPYYSIEQRFGSYDFYRTEASATGPLSKKHGLNYRVDFSYLDSGSFRQNMGNDRIFFAPTLSWQATPDTKLTLSYEHFDDDYAYDAGTPAFGKGLADIPISKTFAQSGLSNNMTNDIIDFRIDHRVNDHIKLNAGAVGYLTEKRWEGIYLGRVNEDPTSPTYQKVARSNWFSPEETDSLTSWINGIFDFETYGVKHKVLLGGEFHDTNLNYQVLSGRVDENGDGRVDNNDLINLFTFDPQSSNLPIDQYRNAAPSTYNIVTQNTSQAIYLQDQMTFWDKLHIMGGFRYDWVQRFQNLSWNGPNTADQRDDTFVSPRVGIVYEAMDWLSVFGNFSESFGPANDYDNGGARLYDLFSATQFEGGLKTKFFDDKLTASLAYYDLERTQFFQDPKSNILGVSVPVTGHSNGVEFDMQGRIYEGLSLIGTYAYTDAKITNDVTSPANVGNRLPYAPTHQASMWLKYDFNDGFLKGFSLGSGVYTAGRRFGDAANSYFDDAYARVDLMAAYKMKLGDTKLTTQVNINNVNDAEYYSLRARRYNLPAEPMTVMGSIKLEY
jgi:iron complex outermembrane receptor protein